MSGEHLSELEVREWFAGDLSPEAVRRASAHADGCEACRAKYRAAQDEQRRFEAQVPFARFEQGVLRAARAPQADPRQRWQYAAAALAAGVALTLVVRPLLVEAPLPRTFVTELPERSEPVRVVRPANRTKGGAEVALRIASPAGTQRVVAPGEVGKLEKGARVRIGYTPGAHPFVAAVSVDVRGDVTALYPEAGQSLPTLDKNQEGMAYLPGSLEFTGAGLEKVVVVLSDRPLSVEDLAREAKQAFTQAAGDLERLPPLQVEGEQFHHLVLKPNE